METHQPSLRIAVSWPTQRNHQVVRQLYTGCEPVALLTAVLLRLTTCYAQALSLLGAAPPKPLLLKVLRFFIQCEPQSVYWYIYVNYIKLNSIKLHNRFFTSHSSLRTRGNLPVLTFIAVCKSINIVYLHNITIQIIYSIQSVCSALFCYLSAQFSFLAGGWPFRE